MDSNTPVRSPPLPLEGGPTYKAQALIDSRQRGRKLQYLMDWERYGPEEWSCVPAFQILDPVLTASFNHEQHDETCTSLTWKSPLMSTCHKQCSEASCLTPTAHMSYEVIRV
ncbi:hypothetical protein P4O66_005680 [Electrophorus voltai]|uniref:Chromo domain-containing protein n=1 Tax=Electrophorus voltai TaxID=2609070 RepID=A0AAD8ZJ85_9TELE|nr:hypothetical protein P4O66_005680 [Electrophorus voltai]